MTIPPASNHPNFEENLNLVQIFLDRVARYRERPALSYKAFPRREYVSLSWKDWANRVRHVAYGLYGLGVRKGDRVALLSENRPEWTLVDLGTLSLGAIVVPVYPTSAPRDVEYILENAEAEIFFVSTLEQYQRLSSIIQGPKIRKVIVFDPQGAKFSSAEKTLSLGELSEKGEIEDSNHPDAYLKSVNSVLPDDLATLIYTSGTTGPPKGVMLTHRNFVANYLGSKRLIPLSDQDVALSFLPLCHIFERLAGYYYMMFHGARIAYAENMGTVPDDIAIVKPTVAAAVPRFYEKVYGRLLEKVEAGGLLTKKLFYWAKGVGEEAAQHRIKKRPPSPPLALKYAIAKLLVFNKLKRKLGGRIRFFISGGAPLSKELGEFFYAAGVLILEGYGLTETSPVMSVNTQEHFKFGTVGKVLPNVEVKIAADGEILTRGPCVMKGYYKNEAATREALQGGWFHTGDIGLIDADGFLKITDRKKDIIVTSGGKNVSPQNIENLLLGDPLFVQVVVLGDKRNYLVALVVPNRREVEHFAAAHGFSQLPYKELLNRETVVAWVEGRVKEKTKGLAPHEQIKYVGLLDRELSLDQGELTPTLKIKRKIVMEKYASMIEQLYRKGEAKSRLSSSPQGFRRGSKKIHGSPTTSFGDDK